MFVECSQMPTAMSSVGFIWTAVLACIVTLLFLKSMAPAARKIGLVDCPGGRKQHQGQVPLIGGLAISIGLTIGLLLLDISLSGFRAYLAGVVLLVVIGVLDDFNELSPRLRLIVQLCVALFLSCWAGLQLNQFGAFLGFEHFSLGLWALPLTVLVVIAMINAVNMIDGINGVAASTSLWSFLSLLILFTHLGALESHAVLLVLCATLIAFLFFNYPVLRYQRRLVFLGDAGSTLLGFSLAWFGIKLNVLSHGVVSPVLLLWIFMVPIFDLVSVTLRRVLIKRVSPFAADREHIHHFLKGLGLRDSSVSLSIMLLGLVANVVALIFYFHPISNNAIFIVFVGVFLLYFIAAQYFWLKNPSFSTNP